MKKYKYNIGDVVLVNVEYPLEKIGIIIDCDIDGFEPPLYRVLIQNGGAPVWIHASNIKKSIESK